MALSILTGYLDSRAVKDNYNYTRSETYVDIAQNSCKSMASKLGEVSPLVLGVGLAAATVAVLAIGLFIKIRNHPQYLDATCADQGGAMGQDGIYRNNLKNRVLAASALPQNCDSHSSLAQGQWSFAPNHNSEEPACQIPDFSGCFGIEKALKNVVKKGLAASEEEVKVDEQVEREAVSLILMPVPL